MRRSKGIQHQPAGQIEPDRQVSSTGSRRILPSSRSRLAAGGALGALVATIAALELGVAGSDAATSSHAAVSQTMHAFVHEDASIGLNFDDGTVVGNQAASPPVIPPGVYSIQVLDDASEHNFHISGPGVDQSTSISDSQTTTWSVNLQPGQIYRFQCDNHPDFMFGVFQTSGTAASGGSSGGTSSGGTSSGGTSSGGSSSGGTSSGGTSGGTSNALAGTLSGSLATNGKLKLTIGGQAVTRLASGRYKITVTDKSSTGGFVLQETGHAATTVSTAPFVGTRSVTVKLTDGKWTFSTSPGAKSKTTFTVAS